MSAPALEDGTRFADRYRIQRAIAKGGMGAVYEVLDENTQRRCALKVMLPEQADDESLRRRFTLEAQVVAKLANDHVIDIRDFGTDRATGSLYLVMELLRGEELESYVQRGGAKDTATTVDLLAQLFFGMSAAHAVPVVHRDLKPENIFIHRPNLEDGKIVVKVLDFGIAKDLSDSSPLTQRGAGTPLWMAPEQSRPNERITPAADVWALGLITFYALTGKVFWAAANEGRIDSYGVMREVLLDPIPDPLLRARELGVALPNGVGAWLATCLQRDPSQRFQDAKTAWSALAAILGREPGPIATGRAPGTAPSPSILGLELSLRPTSPRGVDSAFEAAYRPRSTAPPPPPSFAARMLYTLMALLLGIALTAMVARRMGWKERPQLKLIDDIHRIAPKLPHRGGDPSRF